LKVRTPDSLLIADASGREVMTVALKDALLTFAKTKPRLLRRLARQVNGSSGSKRIMARLKAPPGQIAALRKKDRASRMGRAATIIDDCKAARLVTTCRWHYHAHSAPSGDGPLAFPRRKTGAHHFLPCQRRIAGDKTKFPRSCVLLTLAG
jgi:hypothetical protein